MEKDIKNALHYFGFFGYAPLKDEIYAFLKNKAKKNTFESKLSELIRLKKLKTLRINPSRYTLGEYSISGGDIVKKLRQSKKKVRRISQYIRILSLFPKIRLIGLSGSVAMMNAQPDADIDFFIITAKKRIWTARFTAIALAKIMGIHRSYHEAHVGDKACLNLFFDESKLSVPKKKQNEYVAHEILQMKPVVAKGDIYLRYLDANRWVFDIFPNSSLRLEEIKGADSSSRLSVPILGDVWEKVLRFFQLRTIMKRRTSEIISDKQLWFFPDDFEKKLKNKK